MTQAHFALGLGLGTQNRKGEWLDTFYAQPVLASRQNGRCHPQRY
jgi:2,3,4,5-tetrahydropyridine-2-carboxylate N-succinyltransferase